jgi:hypothetical protein
MSHFCEYVLFPIIFLVPICRRKRFYCTFLPQTLSLLDLENDLCYRQNYFLYAVGYISNASETHDKLVYHVIARACEFIPTLVFFLQFVTTIYMRYCRDCDQSQQGCKRRKCLLNTRVWQMELCMSRSRLISKLFTLRLRYSYGLGAKPMYDLY